MICVRIPESWKKLDEGMFGEEVWLAHEFPGGYMTYGETDEEKAKLASGEIPYITMVLPEGAKVRTS